MNSAVDDVVVVMNATKKNSCASERSTYDWRKTRGREKLQVRTKHVFFFHKTSNDRMQKKKK